MRGEEVNALTEPRWEYLVKRVPSTKKPNLCFCIKSTISGVISSFS